MTDGESIGDRSIGDSLAGNSSTGNPPVGEPSASEPLRSIPSVDSDLGVLSRGHAGPRPIHLRWRYLGLVALGGAFGTAGREALSLLIPATGTFSAVIFCINIVGAFLLGFLLEVLFRRGPDRGGRRTARLLLGTGALGGFTTYSTFATEAALLLTDGEAGAAILFGGITVLIGAVATWAGIALATLVQRSRAPEPDTAGSKAAASHFADSRISASDDSASAISGLGGSAARTSDSEAAGTCVPEVDAGTCVPDADADADAAARTSDPDTSGSNGSEASW